MLIRRSVLDQIAAGSTTTQFRRQRRPTVRAGGTLTTAVGVLAIDSVEAIDERDVTDADAIAAGYGSVGELLDDVRPDGTLYRIRLHFIGEDPRLALRAAADLTDDDRATIAGRLARYDAASTDGPWTATTLALIAEHPEVRAGDLADMAGRERLAFKTDVRKLKALGLTESLAVGYRLSPRGRAYHRPCHTG